MSAERQPEGFPPNVRAIFTSVEDGSIAAGGGSEPTSEHRENGQKALEKNGFPIDKNTLCFITYKEGNTYRKIERVTLDNAGRPITADALFTTEPGIPMFLPVADCIATLVHDPKANSLGILHLGRHSSVNHLIEHFAERTNNELGSNPEDWQIWMSPSLQAANNRLRYFKPKSPEEWEEFVQRAGDNLLVDIPAHNRKRFELLGVKPSNVFVSSIDTYTDELSFSHRAANELQRPDRQGRMALIAMLNY